MNKDSLNLQSTAYRYGASGMGETRAGGKHIGKKRLSR